MRLPTKLLAGASLSVALIGCSSVAMAVDAAAPPSIILSSGHIGRYQWEAALEAPEDQREQQEGALCLSLSMLEPTSRYSAEGNEIAQCQKGTPFFEGLSGGTKGKPKAILGMVFMGEAKNLKLKLRGLPMEGFRLRGLSKDKLGSISSVPLSYFVHGFARKVCIQHAAAYDAKGSVVARLGRKPCV